MILLMSDSLFFLRSYLDAVGRGPLLSSSMYLLILSVIFVFRDWIRYLVLKQFPLQVIWLVQ